jgi:hypothetical protein
LQAFRRYGISLSDVSSDWQSGCKSGEDRPAQALIRLCLIGVIVLIESSRDALADALVGSGAIVVVDEFSNEAV